ncbi:ACP S-malonyltransferase [Candidatus Dependentiae bacterium]|nr:ACP S-malonyltransferase [Candidatus Dependentiae bacterium]
MRIGMIFPGQGSQFLGMGKNLYDQERIIQEHFELASSCLDTNFVRLCFASSERELREVANTQTAIFLVSASIAALLKEKYGIVPDLVAGHSLGEYSAIHVAGGISFQDAIYLLKKRSEFMDSAVKSQEGGMLATLKFPENKLQLICEQYDRPETLDYVAEVANYNSPSQVVVSGTLPELRGVKRDVEALGGKAIMLNVAGAFHSRMLAQAEKQYSVYLLKADFRPLEIPLANNIAGKLVWSPKSIKDSLVKQTSSHIYWWKAMGYFRKMDVIVEVGPGTKFGKMIKREWPEKVVISINEQEDINKLLQLLGRPVPEPTYDHECDHESRPAVQQASL